MSIVTDLRSSLEINVDTPEEVSDNLLEMKVYNDKDTLYIRTPKLYYSNGTILFKGKKKQEVNEFYQCIQRIETKLSELMQEELSSISNEIISLQLFRSSINIPNDLSDPLYLNVDIHNSNIYDRQNNTIDIEEFQQHNGYVIFIISCKKVRISPTYANAVWDVVQAKIFPEKKQSSFVIQSEPSATKKKPVVHFKQFRTKNNEEEPKEKEEITISLDKKA